MGCNKLSQKSETSSVLLSTSAGLSHEAQVLRRCSNWSNRMALCLGPPPWKPDRIGDSWGAPSQTHQKNDSVFGSAIKQWSPAAHKDLEIAYRNHSRQDLMPKQCSHLLQIDLLHFQLPIGRFGRYFLLPRQPREAACGKSKQLHNSETSTHWQRFF